MATIAVIRWVSALILVAAGVAPARETQLIAFEIEDQFETVHKQAEYLGSPLVIIASDREGSRFNRGWRQALADTLDGLPGAGRLKFLRIANARGVPRFMREFVRGKLPQDKDTRILIDWDGVFDEAYGLEPKAANVLLFDTKGLLIHQTHGREVDSSQLAGIVEKVFSIIGEK